MNQAYTSGYFDQQMLAAAVLAAEDGFDGALSGAKFALASNDPAPSKDLVWADFTECVFTGYAKSSAITWAAQVTEQDGSKSLISPTKQFVATTADPQVPDTVRAVLLIDASTPPKVLAYSILEDPITLDATGEGFAAAITINQGGTTPNCEVTILQ